MITPDSVLDLTPDCREVWRALRNAGAYTADTPLTLNGLLTRLGWRRARAMDALTHTDLLNRVKPCGGGWYLLKAQPSLEAAPYTPQAEVWPDELRALWAKLTPAEERLMLRARWRWRAWPNPGTNAPSPPQGRLNLRPVTHLLYDQEVQYRSWSACRGADGEVSLNTTITREAGTRLTHSHKELRALLDQHPDGLTLSEIKQAIPGATFPTLRKWLIEGEALGNYAQAIVGGQNVWKPGREKMVWSVGA